jgi:NADH-quinone oxidoreductase subunit A
MSRGILLEKNKLPLKKMSAYLNELIKISYFIVISFGLALILLAAVYIISFTSKVDFEKSSAYECGFQPFSETNFPFEVQFALIAILFLLFDIEILYLYPLCTSILDFNGIEIFYFICFFIIVTFGLIYEISRHIVNFFNYEQ